MALAKKAEEDLRRYRTWLRKNISVRNNTIRSHQSRGPEGPIKADQATWKPPVCTLTIVPSRPRSPAAPAALLVDPGNMIKANDDKAMVVINQIQPIYITFSCRNKTWLRLKNIRPADS